MTTRDTILVDAQGREFRRPTPPGRDVCGRAWADYARALAEHHDAISECANRAFADEFRRAVRL